MYAKLKGNQVKLTPISHYVSAATFPHLVARKPVDTIFGPVNLSLQLLRYRHSADFRSSRSCGFELLLQEVMCHPGGSQTPDSPLGMSQVL